MKLFFNAQRGGDDATYNTLTEEQWVFALEAREYDFTDLMPADAKAGDLTKGIAVLRLVTTYVSKAYPHSNLHLQL